MKWEEIKDKEVADSTFKEYMFFHIKYILPVVLVAFSLTFLFLKIIMGIAN